MIHIFFSNYNKKCFWLLLISSFFPLCFSKVGSIENLLWIEVLAPIALFFSFIRLAMNKKSFFPYGSRLIITAMLVLAYWAVTHYISSPVSSEVLNRGDNNAVFRRYYEIVTGLCMFFCFFWFCCYSTDGKPFWQQVLTHILWISLFIGYLRLITYSIGMEMPLIGRHFETGGQSLITGAHRIGGLTEVATLGISALIAIHYQKGWSFKFFFLLCLFLFLLIISGGRTASFAVLATFIGYIFFVEKEKRGKKIIFLLMIAVLLFISLQISLFANQFKRLTAVKGGFEVNSPSRYELYGHMWNIFIDQPITGKGIGDQYVPKNLTPFIRNELISGGHGAYISILMLFGLGGGFFLFITLFGSILRGYIYLQKNKLSELFKDKYIALCFTTFYLSILSITFIAEGSGYNNLRLYVLAGIATGIFASSKINIRNSTVN